MADQRAYPFSGKEKILLGLTQLFFICILVQFNDWLTGVITGSLLLCCLLSNSFKEKWELLKERKHIVWMFAFFVWLFISTITSSDTHEGFRFLDPRLPLLYFPLTLGLIRIRKEVWDKILIGFAIIITCYCIACMVFGIKNYLYWKNTAFLYNDALTVLTDQQSVYISILVNFAIYIYARFIFFTKSKLRGLALAAAIFLFGMSYMLASRNMMLVLYLSIIAFVVYYIVTRKKYMKGIAVLVALFVSVLVVFKYFPDTINRFKEILYTKFEYNRDAPESHYSVEVKPDQWNGANFRMAAWRCGWELFQKNPILGTGLGDKKKDLNDKYKEKDFQFAINTKKNLHNNYLDVLAGTGLIGFILFFTGWLILPFRNVLKNKDYLSLLILITFCAAMITEIYFDRTLGGTLVGFFIPFLLTLPRWREDTK